MPMTNKNTIAKRKYHENRGMLYEDKYLLEKSLLNSKNKNTDAYKSELNYYVQFCSMNNLKIHIEIAEELGIFELNWEV